jgi:hypothetical protein
MTRDETGWIVHFSGRRRKLFIRAVRAGNKGQAREKTSSGWPASTAFYHPVCDRLPQLRNSVLRRDFIDTRTNARRKSVFCHRNAG